jgi:chromosome segregation ATPase
MSSAVPFLASERLRRHTGRVVIELSLDTWVSLAALAAALITMYGMLRRGARNDMKAFRAEFTGDITELRTEVKGDITELRAGTEGSIARLEGAIEHLDQRTTRIEENIIEFRSEVKADITRLEENIVELRAEIKADITRLDDRVYALAVGLKPLVERSEQAATAG